MPFTTKIFEATPKRQMMESMGLLFGTLLTGVLLTLRISSLFLLSSRRADRNLLRRNRFLRVYIIILLLTVLTFDAEVFALVNGAAVISSQSHNALQRFVGTLGWALGATTMVIALFGDGILVRLL